MVCATASLQGARAGQRTLSICSPYVCTDLLDLPPAALPLPAALADAAPVKTIALTALKDVLSADQQMLRAWAYAIGQAFLQPYGLSSPQSTVCCLSPGSALHSVLTCALHALTCSHPA